MLWHSTQRTIIYNQHSSFYLLIPESTIAATVKISRTKHMHRWSFKYIHMHIYTYINWIYTVLSIVKNSPVRRTTCQEFLKKKKRIQMHRNNACNLGWVLHLIVFVLLCLYTEQIMILLPLNWEVHFASFKSL